LSRIIDEILKVHSSKASKFFQAIRPHGMKTKASVSVKSWC